VVTARYALSPYIKQTRFVFKGLVTGVFVVYEVTVHKKCSKRPPPEALHIWSRLIMDCRTLSKVLKGAGVANGLTDAKMRW
jgi:hypothetical protein